MIAVNEVGFSPMDNPDGLVFGMKQRAMPLQYTDEVARDLKRVHGVDPDAELTSIYSRDIDDALMVELDKEFSREFLRRFINE